MNRRLLTVLLPLIGATLASGCTTFSDNDAVARVGDVELSSTTLREQARAQGAPDNEALDANIVRQTIGLWITDQMAGLADASKAAEAYQRGLTASGSICLQVLVAESADTAASSLAALESGTDFATVFAASNIDSSLAADSGRIGCLAASQLPLGTGNPFADSLVDLNATNQFNSVELPGDSTQPSAWAVSRFIPYDELGPDETPVVVQNLVPSALGLDIHIDPRYGTYDPVTGTVVALG